MRTYKNLKIWEKATELAYLEDRAYKQLLQATNDIGKMINGLSSRLEANASSTEDWRLKTGD